MNYTRAVSALRVSLAVVCVGLGAAVLLWLLILAALALVLGTVALATVVVVPLALCALGLKLWPGGGLRLTDPDGAAVTLFEAFAHGIKAQRDKRKAGADPGFLRRKMS